MGKTIAIIADKLTLPIDEGLKKFAFKMMEYGSVCTNVDIYTSPEDIGIQGVTLYSSNKLMKSKEIKALINRRTYSDIYYIPEASTTFNTFVRAWMLKMQAPQRAKIHIISSQKRHLRTWQKIILKIIGYQHVITLSQSAYIYMRGLGADSTFIPLGSDTNVFKPVTYKDKLGLRDKYGIPKDAKVALHVGHVRKSRNIQSLITLADKGWYVVIVGSTSMGFENDLARLLRSHGITIMKDYNPRIEEVYQMADVYVFPVKKADAAIEFPLSVLEAMSCSLPIVTTRFGSLPDYFENSEVFSYFETEDEMCVHASNLYGKDASINRQIVRDKFSWNNIFENILCHDE